jgi:predicted nucleotidyltransferase
MMDKVVILYGSYAKGKQKEYSDIDTAIVSQHLRSWIFLSVRRF